MTESDLTEFVRKDLELLGQANWEWKYQTIQEVEIFKSYRGGRIG